jgi:hypothetical protein
MKPANNSNCRQTIPILSFLRLNSGLTTAGSTRLFKTKKFASRRASGNTMNAAIMMRWNEKSFTGTS